MDNREAHLIQLADNTTTNVTRQNCSNNTNTYREGVLAENAVDAPALAALHQRGISRRSPPEYRASEYAFELTGNDRHGNGHNISSFNRVCCAAAADQC